MIQVLLGIGSNIEPEKNIRSAINAIRELDPLSQFSSVFESEAVGFKGANVYNLVASIHTSLPLASLIHQLKSIEVSHGREPKAKKFTDRTLDIDLLTYGELCQAGPPRLPREDIYKYGFVILPLSELCPDKLIPGDSQTYLDAWEKFKQEQDFIPINVFSFD